MRFLLLIGSLFGLCLLAPTSIANAEAVKRYASIVVDSDTEAIIHARQDEEPRYPASLTKIMTLYLTFDALNAGTLKIDEPLTVSRHAASTPPFGLGLRRGQRITVDQAIQALTVRSANDAAVVLAERIAGSESAFADLMTKKARALNMQNTTFKTPHGLPHPEQVTTARDMAKLAVATHTNHQRYYHYFGQSHFTWKGRRHRNTNSLLHWLEGVDGFKTGFTNASGYNLVISAERDGRRIVAVVLGGASGKSRDRHMQDMIERSFNVIKSSPPPERRPVTIAASAEPQPVQSATVPHVLHLRRHGNDIATIRQGASHFKVPSKDYNSRWSIQVGTFATAPAAQGQINTLATLPHAGLPHNRGVVLPFDRGQGPVYLARFTALTAMQAQEACRVLMDVTPRCLVIAPGGG